MEFQIQSSAFRNKNMIPSRYSGEAENLSPPLSWSGLLADAQELALICEDPDAPREKPFVHWLLYHIPPTISTLPEGMTREAQLAEPFHANQGRNSAGEIGYTGPMPPVGHGRHRYFFKIFALSKKLDLSPGCEKEDLLKAMEGKVIASAELVGTYERKAVGKTA
ncbi:MAG: YbhB/YbcL family Raf kinase inhibitor-like protein [Bdellovibrionia bacterium]